MVNMVGAHGRVDACLILLAEVALQGIVGKYRRGAWPCAPTAITLFAPLALVAAMSEISAPSVANFR